MTNAPAAAAVSPEQLAAVQAQLDALKTTVAEKDRIIGDLNTTKATLEARVAGAQPAAVVTEDVDNAEIERESQQIMEEAQTDPASASKKLGKLITRVAESTAKIAAGKALEQVPGMMENNTFASTIRTENADLLAIEPGMELLVANRAREIMAGKPKADQTFQEFQKTVREVIAEKRKVYEPLLKKPAAPETPPAKPAVPAGAKGEEGASRPAGAPPAAASPTDGDDRTTPGGRTALAQSKGLF